MSNTASASLTLARHHPTVFSTLTVLLLSLTLLITACGGGTSNEIGSSGNTATPSTVTATVSWTAPTTREDGSAMAITELAGYRIYYGISPTNTNIVVEINAGSTTERTITGLTPGTYYFKVSAYDTAGVEGPKSSVVSKIIP